MNFGFAVAQFLIYAAILGAVLFFLLLIGQLIASILYPESIKEENYKSGFIQLVTGICAVTFVYAQIRSGFSTMLVMGYLVIIFVIADKLLSEKKMPVLNAYFLREFSIRSILRIWMKTFVIGLGTALFYALILYNPETHYFRVPHYDFITYANISSALNVTGTENIFYQSFLFKGYSLASVNSLYHYPELWFTALVVLITGKSAVLTGFFVTVPVLFGAILLGILSLYENYAAISWKVVLGMALLVNLSGIYFPFYDKFVLTEMWTGVCLANFICLPKFCFSGVIFIAAVLLIFENRWALAMLVLLILPICNVGNCPGVLGGGLLILFALLFFPKAGISKGRLLYLASFYLIFSLFYFFYIKLFCDTMSNNPVSQNIVTKLIAAESYLPIIKVYVGNLLFLYIRTAVPYLPIIALVVLLFIVRRSDIQSYHINNLMLIGLVAAILFVGSLSAFFVNDDVPDNAQLFGTNFPFLNISIVVLLIPLIVRFNQLKLFPKLAMVLMFLLFTYSLSANIRFRYFESWYKSYNSYGGVYMKRVLTAISSCDNKLGVSWSDKSKYATTPFGFTLYEHPGVFVCLNDPFTDLADLTNYQSLSNTNNRALDMQYLNNTPFMLYLNQKGSSTDSNAIQKLQYSFIQENNISYGFTSDLKILPDNIKEKVTQVIRDEKSGEYFVRFRL